ncbi:MAG: type IX secretion system outer membrane channel protein PorV [Bacteroidaceae bacterium]|nr:type IX secretion system outer membrane channel protein PorV [Bacteroidaceae bacterium]
MNKKKILSLAFGCTAFALTANAQDKWNQLNPVNYAVTSLAIAPDARAAGLGDVGAATDPDVNSQYWNPAKYPFCISRAGVSLNYTPWLRNIVDGIDLANVTGYMRLGEYDAISASLRYFSLGDVMVGEVNSEETIRPYEMAVDFAYSRMLSETFSAAVGLRFIHSDLGLHTDDYQPGSAFAADIAFYHNGYINMGQRECQLSWGLNVSNIGSKISFNEGSSSEFIPTNMRFGMALLVPVDDYNSFTIAADANKLLIPTMPTYKQYIYSDDAEEVFSRENSNWNEMSTAEKDAIKAEALNKGNYSDSYTNWLAGEGYNSVSPISGIFKSFNDAPRGFKEELEEVQWSIGAEYSYNDRFFIRGGYHYEHPNKGNRKYFTVGAGFKMSTLSIDAGYVISTAQSNPLDQTVRFSLAFDMDGIQDFLGKRRR